MNAMLKAQMFATALNAYFVPSLRTTDVDLTQVCKAIGTCVTPPTGFENTSLAFGGASHMTILGLLTWASTAPIYVSFSNWYSNVKSTQELAKDTFDAINNAKIFAWAGP